MLQLGTPDMRYGALKAGAVKGALVSSTQALTALKDGFRELRYEQPPWMSSPIVAGDDLLSRERAMLRFRRMRTVHIFASVHASVSIHFNQERSLSSRDIFKTKRAAALAEWRDLCAD